MIQWADEQAEQLLGARAGMTFTALAAPGAEEALVAVCQGATHARVTHHTLRVHVNGQPVTACCAAVPAHGGVALLIALLSPTVHTHGPGMPVQPYPYDVPELVPAPSPEPLPARLLERQQHQIQQLRQDLVERNRGIMALHTELDEKSTATMTSAEIKSRIVSSVNHELRTAIHSILGLSKLLLDELDGPLTAEQKTQVGFIRKAAEDLSHMAGDLVDLAKLDSGAMELRVQRSSVTELFGTLRGMLAPMLSDPARVTLSFDEPPEPLELDTDVNKLSQILRNLIANALRFTECGEVRVSAIRADGQVRLAVRDTGIGIAPEDHERIFEGLRRMAPRDTTPRASGKSNGLGLPFARKLARLLGGDIAVTSQLGHGATFTVTIPAIHADAAQVRALHERRQWMPPASAPVLLLENDHRMSSRFEPHLGPAGFPLVSARTVQEARELLARSRPAAIVLDIMIEGETSWRFLGQLESAPVTRDIPVLVLTGSHREAKALARRKGELWLNPVAQGHLARTLESLTGARAGSMAERSTRGPATTARVLVAGADDWVSYLVRKLLDGTGFEVQEAPVDELDIAVVQEKGPRVLLLDASSPRRERKALDLLAQLDTDARTRPIPVVLLVPHLQTDEERESLVRQPDAWLSRALLSSELAVRLIEEALHGPPPAITASASWRPDDV